MNANIKQITFIIKWLVLAAVVFFLYQRIFKNADLESFTRLFSFSYERESFVLILIVLIGVLFNWGIETYKWKYIAGEFEDTSWSNALKGVLTGLTISTFTPNRIGDFSGRVLWMKKTSMLKASVLSLYSSFSQMLTTVLFGAISIWIIYSTTNFFDESPNTAWWLLAFSTTAAVFLTLFYFNYGWVKFVAGKFKWFAQTESYFEFFDLNRALTLLVLSHFRFLVFSLQYFLLLQFFSVPIDFYHSLLFSAFTFFIVSVIPSIAFADLGIREMASILVFGSFIPMDVEIAAASFFLWIINIAIPSLIGGYFLWKVNINPINTAT